MGGGKLKYQDNANGTYPPLFTEFSHGCRRPYGVKLIDVWQFDRFPSGTRALIPRCFENIEWHRTGETWCRGDYIFTFFYLFYSLHQIIVAHIRYYGFVTIYFARMEHCTCIGKDLKLHLKISSFAKTEPSAMNENGREGERLK